MLPSVLYLEGREYRLISDRGAEKIRLSTTSIGALKQTLLSRFSEDTKNGITRVNWRFDDTFASIIAGAPALQATTNVTWQFTTPQQATDNTSIATRLITHLRSMAIMATDGGGDLDPVVMDPDIVRAVAFMRGEQ